MSDRGVVAATLAAGILSVSVPRQADGDARELTRLAAKIYFDCLEALQQERMRRSPQTRMLAGDERRPSFG